jgi:hypothetical protein
LELRSRQQTSGLELVRTRLLMTNERLEVIENELRKASEGLEQALRIPSPSRPMPSIPSMLPERADSIALPSRPPRGTNPLTPLPKRFSGPLTPPGNGPLLPPESDGARLVH